ncbi:hypothetical protein FRB90_000224 [Tulasnella sp. 427]|nr:hypothetical protein FRB90_000224 [Tulasnella sp. 427]
MLSATKDKIDVQQVNLFDGGNFDPRFSQKICLLRSDDYSQQLTVTMFETPPLPSQPSSRPVKALWRIPPPTKVSWQADFVARIHEDAIDPNFALLSARNDEEVETKHTSIPGLFICHREPSPLPIQAHTGPYVRSLPSQAASQDYAPTAPDLRSFYDAKLQSNAFINPVYAPDSPTELKKT